jgi:hypothetical protein
MIPSLLRKEIYSQEAIAMRDSHDLKLDRALTAEEEARGLYAQSSAQPLYYIQI